jgi:hypothetical protein
VILQVHSGRVSAPSPVTLYEFCVHCGQPVKLHFDVIEDTPESESPWTCPKCRQQNTARFPGTLVGLSRIYPSR